MFYQVDSILSCQRKRQAQLSKLKTWMKRMQNNESYDDENCESHDDENCESHDNEKYTCIFTYVLAFCRRNGYFDI